MEKLSKLLIVLMLLTFFGCSDDEPDPRAALVGTYEMEDFDVSFTSTDDIDTVITVSTNPDIEFERETELHSNELKLDIEDFIDDSMQKTIGVMFDGTVISPDFDNDFIVEVTGNEFVINETNFVTNIQEGDTYELITVFDGEGSLDEEELTLDFTFTIYLGESNFTFSGTATGEVD